ncbi:MAG: TonB-dependent receptor [Gammaproteobacteria bacterium]|nr:MAG: TonB-dependent receptor [Gammaproteobacteria bacterium]
MGSGSGGCQRIPELRGTLQRHRSFNRNHGLSHGDRDLLGYCDVKAFTDVDLYAQYAFSKHLSVHAAILNVFDSQPPVDLETYGASGNDPYNPAMHQAGAIGRFYNLGASYTF